MNLKIFIIMLSNCSFEKYEFNEYARVPQIDHRTHFN